MTSATPDLEGTLVQTNIVDVLQFLHTSGKTGELTVRNQRDGATAQAYFSQGQLFHVVVGDTEGLPALTELIGWEEGDFHLAPDVLSPRYSIDLPLQHAIIEAARQLDESRRRAGVADRIPLRSSAEILEDFLALPEVVAAVVIGRDGIVIEFAGEGAHLDIEHLGASLAHAVGGIESMGSELEVDPFEELIVRYRRAVILCCPVADAVLAIVAPSRAKLGIIRHKAKSLIIELYRVF